MKRLSILAAILSPMAFLANCANASDGDNAETSMSSTAEFNGEFAITEHDTLDEPWAATFVPGQNVLVVTTKPGKIMGYDLDSGNTIPFTGAPQVDYGGQGGLGDIAFLPGENDMPLSGRTIYLSWVEAGQGDTRGAVLGKGMLHCKNIQTCDIRDLTVIWRQAKVSGRGHYSHRIAFSPNGKYLFISSGDRQKMEPAQDTQNNLGSIVRLNLDGTPASGNAFTGEAGKAQDIWSFGHRNVLGLAFDAQGRLWDLEHGPAGGDELNLVEKGANYGWPRVSDGDHYNGDPIPNSATSTAYHQSAITWNPVIAPGNLIFYRGNLFPGWKGQAIMSGLSTETIIRVAIEGNKAREIARYDMEKRIRSVIEGPDGALWVLEDGKDGRLLELRPS